MAWYMKHEFAGYEIEFEEGYGFICPDCLSKDDRIEAICTKRDVHRKVETCDRCHCKINTQMSDDDRKNFEKNFEKEFASVEIINPDEVVAYGISFARGYWEEFLFLCPDCFNEDGWEKDLIDYVCTRRDLIYGFGFCDMCEKKISIENS